MGNGDYASVVLVHYLFGIFCAYWAQATGRNPWLWLFYNAGLRGRTGQSTIGRYEG
jgi:hypothetical protein